MTGQLTPIGGDIEPTLLPETAITPNENDFGDDLASLHRNAPRPDPKCLYGLIGEVAHAGSQDTETNPYAIAANFMAYLSCAVGRGVFLPIGNTRHHARLFCLHIGRSGRGRKGDAVSLVLRIDEALQAIDSTCTPQIHRGGLSTREGLAALIHDGYQQGRLDIPPIEDKRLWVVESEFANVLQQGRRDGNTLSAALRDCWDGVDLKPATKSNRVHASDPHVCLSGAISPSELTSLMSSREMSNGFANRFMMIWAERTRILPFRWLKGRGLKGVAFVVSDQHSGLREAVGKHFHDATWQRCQVHLMRNILGSCGAKIRAEVSAAAKLVFQAADLPEARRRLAEFSERFAKTAPKAVACLEAGFEDAMAVIALPEKYRKRLRTTNMQERLNEEIRRRERVIRIFPNDESALRLIGALLAEQNENWLERRYLDMQEYHEWAAACAAAREGNNVVALSG